MDSPSAERWRRVEALMDGALDLPEGERDQYLEAAAAGDTSLIDEVRSLIAAGENPKILAGESAIALAADLVARVADDSPAVADRVAQRIGPFRLIAELGQGGMGSVYLAEREAHFAQRVAVKLIRRGLHLDRDLVRRFVDERQILASLDHPGIARLLDGGITEDGLPWFAMEFVDGEPADRYCDGHKLPIDKRLELFCTICDAVAYAHERGIVHRDLKPSNILVRPDGAVKLLDFGIAKLLAPNEPASAEATRTGARLLTPEFASPEQIRGEVVTPASDVYSLGVLLYRLLTGHRPYRPAGRTMHDLERAVLEQPPERPSDTIEVGRDRLRGALDDIVLQSLAKAPADRYQSADALAADVRHFLAGEPIRARPARRWTRPRMFAWVSVATFVVALGLWIATRPGATADGPTVSPVARRFYEEGMQAYYRGDSRAARRLFETSIAEDSTFAMPYYYLANTTPNPAQSRAHLDHALRLATRASDRDRLFIETAHLYTFSDPRAVAKSDTLASRYPDDLTGRLFAGQARLASGDLTGALSYLRPLATADSVARIDANARCPSCEARALVVTALLFADSVDAAERALRFWVEREPGRSGGWVALSNLFEMRGQPDSAREAYRRAVEIEPTRQGAADYYGYHEMRRGDYDAADRALGEIVATSSPDRQAEAYWYLAISLREQGRYDESVRAVRAHRALLISLNPGVPSAQFALADAQSRFDTGRYREAVAVFDSVGMAYATWPTSFHARYRTWTLGLGAASLAALNDTAELSRRVDSARISGAKSLLARDQRMHHYMRGLVLAASHDDAGAVGAFREAMTWRGYGFSRVDYELGSALLRLGRAREAVVALQPATRDIESTALYVTRTEVRERLAQAWEAAGNRDSALANYRAVAHAWRRADPRLQSRLAVVRGRITALEAK